MALRRSRGLEMLDGIGVLEFLYATGAPRSRYVVKSRGQEYAMEARTVNSYIIGTDDSYLRTRAEVARILEELGPPQPDEADYAGRVVRALDERIGQALHRAAEPFLAARRTLDDEKQDADTARNLPRAS